MEVLTKKTLDQIKESLKCRNRLAYELNKSEPVIRNYVDDNHIMLTSATALRVIREELGISETENILEKQP